MTSSYLSDALDSNLDTHDNAAAFSLFELPFILLAVAVAFKLFLHVRDCLVLSFGVFMFLVNYSRFPHCVYSVTCQMA